MCIRDRYHAKYTNVYIYKSRPKLTAYKTGNHVSSLSTKLTYAHIYWLNPLYRSITMLGTYKIIHTQPFIPLLGPGTFIPTHTQPGLTSLRKYAYHLWYRSIKWSLALKSPEIRRTLKPVATAAVCAVFSVNPLSLSNCRTCRTTTPQLAIKLKFMTFYIITSHDEE